MAYEEIARFPVNHLSVKADGEKLLAGRLVIFTGKSDEGDYLAKHAGAGVEKVFGCVQRETADPAADPAPDTHDNMLRTDIVRSGSIIRVECSGEVDEDDELSTSAGGKVATAETGAAAHVDTGLVGENNGITWTALEAGEDGNDLTVAIIDPPGNGVALSVDVDGTDIVVTAATDGASAITSTAADVMAAIAEHDAASQLVGTGNKGASNGTGKVKAVAETPLAGGEDPGPAVCKAVTAGKNSIIEAELY